MARTATVDTPEQNTVYADICDILQTSKGEGESPEEFKDRVVYILGDVEEWPEEKYNELPEGVILWVDEAANIAKANEDRKRKKALPVMPGLDDAKKKYRGRPGKGDTTTEKRERKRSEGSDCVTRTMRILSENPEMTFQELTQELAIRHTDRSYSTSAVRYGMTAWNTACNILREQHKLAEDERVAAE